MVGLKSNYYVMIVPVFFMRLNTVHRQYLLSALAWQYRYARVYFDIFVPLLIYFAFELTMLFLTSFRAWSGSKDFLK